MNPTKINYRWRFDNIRTRRIMNKQLMDFFYELIKQNEPISRPELSKFTNIPSSTIYIHLKSLLKQNKIEKIAISNKKRGRSIIYYHINGE